MAAVPPSDTITIALGVLRDNPDVAQRAQESMAALAIARPPSVLPNVDEVYQIWAHGSMLFHSNRHAAALTLFRRLMSSTTNPIFKIMLTINIGLLCAQLHNFSGAERYFATAFALSPKLCLPAFLLGIAAHENGHFESAHSAFRACHTLMSSGSRRLSFSNLGFLFVLDIRTVEANLGIARHEEHMTRLNMRRREPVRAVPWPMPRGIIFEAPDWMYTLESKMGSANSSPVSAFSPASTCEEFPTEVKEDLDTLDARSVRSYRHRKGQPHSSVTALRRRVARKLKRKVSGFLVDRSARLYN